MSGLQNMMKQMQGGAGAGGVPDMAQMESMMKKMGARRK
jgi:hypothetical protein